MSPDEPDADCVSLDDILEEQIRNVGLRTQSVRPQRCSWPQRPEPSCPGSLFLSLLSPPLLLLLRLGSSLGPAPETLATAAQAL